MANDSECNLKTISKFEIHPNDYVKFLLSGKLTEKASYLLYAYCSYRTCKEKLTLDLESASSIYHNEKLLLNKGKIRKVYTCFSSTFNMYYEIYNCLWCHITGHYSRTCAATGKFFEVEPSIITS